MSRIRCPECDSTVRVPDDEERSSVRCGACGHKIRLDAGDDEDTPRNRGPVASKKGARSRKSKEQVGQQSSLLNNVLQYWPVFVVVPLSLLFLVLGFFVSAGGALTAILGFVVSLAAFVWASVLVFKFGHYISLDYLEFLGPLRWLLIIGFLGLYILGYLVFLYVAQVMSAIKKPNAMLPWMFLQVYGVFLMIAGPVVYSIGFARPRPPDFAQQNQPANVQRPDPDQGGRPNQDKGKQPDDKPPAQLTGDAPLDKALADLEFGKGSKQNGAADLLVNTPPNEHRAVVAKKLAELAKSADFDIRTSALRSLGTWATANEVPLLIEFLNDKEISRRNDVLRFIGKLHDERTAAPLVRCLVKLETRFHAAQALRDMGPMAEKEVLTALSQKDADVRGEAIRILKDIGTLQSVPALEAARAEFILQGTAEAAIKAIQDRSKK